MSEPEIILPKNERVAEAYKAILKVSYLDRRDIYFFHKFINIVQSDCGVTFETAKKYCMQLDQLNLLRYVSSSLSGHSYKVCVFLKNDCVEISYINNLQEACKLIETNFGDIVETEFIQIRKMNIPAKSPEMQSKEEEYRVFNSKPIKKDVDDVLKTSFRYARQSKEGACLAFEQSLKNMKKSDSLFLEST